MLPKVTLPRMAKHYPWHNDFKRNNITTSLGLNILFGGRICLGRLDYLLWEFPSFFFFFTCLSLSCSVSPSLSASLIQLQCMRVFILFLYYTERYVDSSASATRREARSSRHVMWFCQNPSEEPVLRKKRALCWCKSEFCTSPARRWGLGPQWRTPRGPDLWLLMGQNFEGDCSAFTLGPLILSRPIF